MTHPPLADGTSAPQARLTVIGSGTLFPSARRSSAALHLALPEGGVRSFLMDCGWGTLHALARCAIDWEEIDAVLVTHYHGDHFGDLPGLLGAWRQQGRTKPLVLLGPDGLHEKVRALAGVFGPWILEPGFSMEVVEVMAGDEWTDAAGTTRLSVVATPHTEASIAVRVSGVWGAIGYTGDTAPSDDVAAFLVGCDLLVAECALPDPPPFSGHLTPRSLAALARIARPGLLLVTHVYPPADPEDAVAALSARYEGRVVAAADGMVVRCSPGKTAVDRPPARE